jgi:hypothetical protein
MIERYHYSTPEDARDLPSAPMPGWNLRCNRCGTFGADWVPNERPGWGSLALCSADAAELAAEHRRHWRALADLRSVNYEQPVGKPMRQRAYDY